MEAFLQSNQKTKIRVLLVEDELLINLDLCDILVTAGYEVLGPAYTVADARFLMKYHTPHIAIVDVFLKDDHCSEIARQLCQRDIPFCTYSGYGRYSAEIDGFADAPWLAKPALPAEVLDMLAKLSGQADSNRLSKVAERSGSVSLRAFGPHDLGLELRHSACSSRTAMKAGQPSRRAATDESSKDARHPGLEVKPHG